MLDSLLILLVTISFLLSFFLTVHLKWSLPVLSSSRLASFHYFSPLSSTSNGIFPFPFPFPFTINTEEKRKRYKKNIKEKREVSLHGSCYQLSVIGKLQLHSGEQIIKFQLDEARVCLLHLLSLSLFSNYLTSF